MPAWKARAGTHTTAVEISAMTTADAIILRHRLALLGQSIRLIVPITSLTQEEQAHIQSTAVEISAMTTADVIRFLPRTVLAAVLILTAKPELRKILRITPIAIGHGLVKVYTAEEMRHARRRKLIITRAVPISPRTNAI